MSHPPVPRQRAPQGSQRAKDDQNIEVAEEFHRTGFGDQPKNSDSKPSK